MHILSRARNAFANVGFKVIHVTDLEEHPDPIPWYYPLEGDISKAQPLYDLFMCWKIICSGRLIGHSTLG